jgi:hypothetical protein
LRNSTGCATEAEIAQPLMRTNRVAAVETEDAQRLAHIGGDRCAIAGRCPPTTQQLMADAAGCANTLAAPSGRRELLEDARLGTCESRERTISLKNRQRVALTSSAARARHTPVGWNHADAGSVPATGCHWYLP